MNLRTALPWFVLIGIGSGCGPPRADSPAAGIDAVFVIVVDTMRADRLSCAGYRGHQTPRMDSLAQRGALFRNAFSPAPWTGPSVGSMMTSLYPTQLGLVELESEPGREWAWQEPHRQVGKTIPSEAVTVAEVFADAGFHTAAFVNQPALLIGNGFAQGFAEWFYPATPTDIERHDPSRPATWKRWSPQLRNTSLVDADLVSEFTGWLDGRGAGPLFVWIQLLTPHAPYNPPSEFLAPSAVGRPPTIADLYDAEIRVVDKLVGEILSAIDGRFGLERSVVVLTSDHGEALGEHGMVEHGHSLHAEVVRVPLILAGPGIRAGAAVDEPVGTLDLLPTLVELAIGPRMLPPAIEGKSLLPTLNGRATGRPVYTEGMLYGSTERGLIVDGERLLHDQQGGRWALYDVRADPEEAADLAGERPGRVTELRSAMERLHRRLQEQAMAPAGTVLHEDDARQALRSLGYVD